MNNVAIWAVVVATEEIGNGEEGGNNKGPHVRKYSRGREGNWCATFCSWCFEQSAERVELVIGKSPKYPTYSRGAKRFVRNTAKLGRYLDTSKEDPGPGDVIGWHRGRIITWRGHVGLVLGYIAETDTLITIEGNSGSYAKYRGRVRVKLYKNGSWRKKLYRVSRMDD